MNNEPPAPTNGARNAIEADLLRQIRSLRFGQITVQIHDARIVQIERTEKIRTDQRADDAHRN